MIAAAIRYLNGLVEGLGQGWNRFWYTPRDVYTLCVLRILTGLVALYCHFSYWPDLVRWFGSRGLLPIDTVRFVAGAGSEAVGSYAPSYLWLTDSPGALWVLQAAGTVVLLMFTLGCLTRISSLLSLVVLLSYVHRAPMIAGQVEPVLTMLVAYLSLAPAGNDLSVDRWWRQRKMSHAAPVLKGKGHEPPKFVAATVSVRLIQLHTAALCLMMGLTKLAGVPWWSGEAVWWLIAQSQSRLIDLTFLRDHVYLINAWTHAIVAFELTFSLLIWNRTARPLLLALAVVMWVPLGLITGLVTLSAAMLIAGCSFISSAAMRAMFSACRKSHDSVTTSVCA